MALKRSKYPYDRDEETAVRRLLTHHPPLSELEAQKVALFTREAVRLGFVSWPRKVTGLVDVAGCRVLDVGCGNSLHGVGFLIAGVGDYLGIDPHLNLDAASLKSKVTHQFESIGFTLGEVNDCYLPIQLATASTTDLVKSGWLFDVVVLHNVTEHVMDLEKLFQDLFYLTRRGGKIIFHHHNFFSWDGHHCSPKWEDDININDLSQALVVDWAHLSSNFPSDHYVSRGLNRVTLDELAAAVSNYFEIEMWKEIVSPKGRGAGRFHKLSEPGSPEYSYRDLTTKNVLGIAVNQG
jgi:SAM-dependent methyltransferase